MRFILIPILIILSACVTTPPSERQPSSGQSEGYSKVSSTGAIFVRDNSFPAFGEAYRDPSNLIWGDAIMGKDGSPWMTHYRAEGFCRESGGRLPTREEFTRLVKELGKDSQGQFNMVSTTGESVIPHFGGQYWTSDNHGWQASMYDVDEGNFVRKARSNFAYARCVTNKINI